MKLLIILCGIPGSGKSTLSQYFLKNTLHSVKVVSSDSIREEINGSESSQDNPHLVWSKFYDDAFESLVTNQITILDATFARRRDRTLANRILKVEGEVITVCIHLDLPFGKCSKQNESRSRVVPGFVLESMYSSLVQFPPSKEDGFDDVYRITSTQEIQTVCQNIMNLIN